MLEAADFEPDPDATADRTPAACPFCGFGGAFDGQGRWTDELKIYRAGVTSEFEAEHVAVRCTDCNGRFTMTVDVTPIEDGDCDE